MFSWRRCVIQVHPPFTEPIYRVKYITPSHLPPVWRICSDVILCVMGPDFEIIPALPPTPPPVGGNPRYCTYMVSCPLSSSLGADCGFSSALPPSSYLFYVVHDLLSEPVHPHGPRLALSVVLKSVTVHGADLPQLKSHSPAWCVAKITTDQKKSSYTLLSAHWHKTQINSSCFNVQVHYMNSSHWAVCNVSHICPLVVVCANSTPVILST